MSKPFIDLVGQVFGRLTVDRFFGKNERLNHLWLCKCTCGKEKVVSASQLRSGGTKSCGCRQEEIKHKEKKIDLTGQVFDRLTVVEFAGKDKRGKILWSCRCVCGKEKAVRSDRLKSGATRSCGCLQREAVARIQEENITHGHARRGNVTKTRQAWNHMKQRCYNPKDTGYKHYGGRGIQVCDRWLDSFENFLEDMGEVPYRLTLERVNNNGNYEPGNCKWTTQKRQQNNRRNNKIIEFNGKTHTMSEWADILGINSATLKKRLRNWSIERALTEDLIIIKSNKPNVEKQIV